MARQKVLAVIGLLASLGGTAALAGRGDLDTSYGQGGRLTAATIFYDPGIRSVTDLVALNLPDDRLVTIEGNLVRRFDAEGRPDLSFGDNGETTNTSSLGSIFNPAATPDGGLILAGLLGDERGLFEALVRLDRDGKVLASFGGSGDGAYRLTTGPMPEYVGGIRGTLMGVAVDSAGRVLLANRSWDVYGRCTGAPIVQRLMPDGSIDSTFGVNGRFDVTGVDLCTQSLLLRAREDGGVLVGGGRAVIALDAGGEPDASFGVQGLLALDPSVEWSSGVVLADGDLLLAGTGSQASQSRVTLAKFNGSGQRDTSFGGGTGAVRFDLGEEFFGVSGLRSHVPAMASTMDGEYVYLQVSMTRNDDDTECAGGIARLAGDGTIDTSFGDRGLTCLDYGALPLALIGLQRNGAPLFGQLDGSIYRLLIDASPSPGFLTLARSGNSVEVAENVDNATVSVVRTAGRDGAASIHFYTSALPCDYRHSGCGRSHIAGADSDYLAASGRLEWADGEAGRRSANIEILDDLDGEGREGFYINFNDPQGGAQLYGVYHRFIVFINDDDGSAPTGGSASGNSASGNSASGNSASGGVGSTPWCVIVVLAALAALARRRPRDVRRQS